MKKAIRLQVIVQVEADRPASEDFAEFAKQEIGLLFDSYSSRANPVWLGIVAMDEEVP